MASTCPVDLDTLRLRAEIESIYRRVATEPSGDFHFHRGPTYAAEMLGYDAVALARLPADNTASFAGVANPRRIAPTAAGATVVDIGCGAGMDLLLAAQSVGPGAELVVLLGRVGFDDVVVKERFDCFRETSKERVAKKYGVVGVNVYARKSR